ncbi:hypothetical protein Dtox_0848 [Desulfofarcimen acetoxidans DSM 771]|uniref:Uncharacterized protein n=1 Tax=Desulfofarcimen acetoxidans (strain ATCC 49208 / DSM 771 / KCTC 5769 / VKM B-1644 / 5575) TaxID=485916 RepID=C8W289_DESAS|nr:hypothetical protein Dtox_0848 [Desulfofarcimen acetoxidans DSM 771]
MKMSINGGIRMDNDKFQELVVQQLKILIEGQSNL